MMYVFSSLSVSPRQIWSLPGLLPLQGQEYENVGKVYVGLGMNNGHLLPVHCPSLECCSCANRPPETLNSAESVENVFPSDPPAANVELNTAEHLCETTATALDRAALGEEEETPTTHSRSYYKRLCAGDRGVLDDQNRHLPPMKDEEIEGWFRANEKFWTHPATIVYRLRDGRRVAMFTKRKPDKGRWRRKKKKQLSFADH